MLHHVSFGINDIAKARAFYDPLMALLGLRVLSHSEKSVDYGVGEIIFSLETPSNGKFATAGNGTHIAFNALGRGMVKEFYETGLKNGGRDGGPPGERPEYDPHYYGAFLYDPEGNKIEAVTFSAK